LKSNKLAVRGGGLRQLKKGWKELAEFAKEAREDIETSKKKK
jgi:hypothetical protein